MARLSSDSSEPLWYILELHLPQACMADHASSSADLWEEVKYSISRARRRWNKLHGRPATRDVGIIATVLDELRITVDGTLGNGATKRVLPAIPALPGLTLEDLRDAMEYAGLFMLVTDENLREVASETSAALAGTGYGIWEHYVDADACREEEAHMPTSSTLTLSFTHSAFSAGLLVCNRPTSASPRRIRCTSI